MNIRQKRCIGITLHSLATACYILGISLFILLVLEVWKGIEILPYLKNFYLAFGGAREVTIEAIAIVIIGKFINMASRRVYPRLHKGPYGIREER